MSDAPQSPLHSESLLRREPDNLLSLATPLPHRLGGKDPGFITPAEGSKNIQTHQLQGCILSSGRLPQSFCQYKWHFL